MANHVSRKNFGYFTHHGIFLYHGFTVGFSPNNVSRNRSLPFHGSRKKSVARIHGKNRQFMNSQKIHGRKWLITDSRNPLPPPPPHTNRVCVQSKGLDIYLGHYPPGAFFSGVGNFFLPLIFSMQDFISLIFVMKIFVPLKSTSTNIFIPLKST